MNWDGKLTSFYTLRRGQGPISIFQSLPLHSAAKFQTSFVYISHLLTKEYYIKKVVQNSQFPTTNKNFSSVSPGGDDPKFEAGGGGNIFISRTV